MPARLDSARAAQHALRRLLLAGLVHHPGATVSTLAAHVTPAQVDTPKRATVEYHLRRLEQHGLVQSGIAGGARRYYPAGGPWSQDPVAYGLAVTTESRVVARSIVERPGITSADLAWTLHRHAGWRPERTLEALRRFAAADLIQLRVDGRARFCYPQAKLVEMVNARPPPAAIGGPPDAAAVGSPP